MNDNLIALTKTVRFKLSRSETETIKRLNRLKENLKFFLIWLDKIKFGCKLNRRSAMTVSN